MNRCETCQEELMLNPDSVVYNEALGYYIGSKACCGNEHTYHVGYVLLEEESLIDE